MLEKLIYTMFFSLSTFLIYIAVAANKQMQVVFIIIL